MNRYEPIRFAIYFAISVLLATNAVKGFAQQENASKSEIAKTTWTHYRLVDRFAPHSRVIPNAILPIRCEVKKQRLGDGCRLFSRPHSRSNR